MSRLSNAPRPAPHPDNRLSLRLNPRLSGEAASRICKTVAGLPALTGASISVSTRNKLTAHRGKLLSGAQRGIAVHAASFIRQRRIVLEAELLEEPYKLPLIAVHEIFHFVWARLGNGVRRSFTCLLERERQRHARGELGESAAAQKNTGSWKDYVCESFCDTAAWMYAGVNKSPEFTLAAKWSNQRKTWFESLFETPRKC